MEWKRQISPTSRREEEERRGGVHRFQKRFGSLTLLFREGWAAAAVAAVGEGRKCCRRGGQRRRRRMTPTETSSSIRRKIERGRNWHGQRREGRARESCHAHPHPDGRGASLDVCLVSLKSIEGRPYCSSGICPTLEMHTCR